MNVILWQDTVTCPKNYSYCKCKCTSSGICLSWNCYFNNGPIKYHLKLQYFPCVTHGECHIRMASV